MPLSIVETPIGPINGSNQDFTTSKAYLPGTLYPIVDGLMRRPGDIDGILEVDPALGTFTTKEILFTGRALVVQFIDTSPESGPGTEIIGVLKVQRIHGIVLPDDITGVVT